ncbi:MAG: hydroxymethylbilane synthase [Syntrophomonadaceae bacterium]
MFRLRLGTRGSRLALWQADWVAREMHRLYPTLQIEIKVIKTQGDRILDVALSKIGDKGLFTKEIENELLAGEIDLAVHSMKDLPTILPPGLIAGAVLQRENPQDVLISSQGFNLETLPQGGRIGTSSLRRIAQLKALRPDLQPVDLRGNLETRLKKMEEQKLDGIILAYAGVKRLGFDTYITQMIDTELILPAVSQGAVLAEVREGDQDTRKLIAPINDQAADAATRAERALLRELEGGCQVPVAALAQVRGDRLQLRAMVASLDGEHVIRDSHDGEIERAEDIGRNLAMRMLDQGAGQILSEIRRLGD